MGVAERLHKEGLVHHGCLMNHNGKSQRIDFSKHTQKEVTIYGQQEVIKDMTQMRSFMINNMQYLDVQDFEAMFEW